MLNISKKLLVTALLVVLVVVSNCQDNKDANNQEKEDEYRLPSSTIPKSYDIKFTKVDFTEFTFEGSVKINAQIDNGTQEIVLHKGKFIKIQNVIVTKQSSGPVSVKPNYNEKTEKLTITIEEQKLKKGDIVDIELNFTGILRDDMIGFYRSYYYDNGNKPKWLASTQFESTHARHAFPCFDEPALKAKFKISIELPTKDYKCLSNMPHKLEKNTCIFEESVPMSTYLVAFIVSDFDSVSNSDNTVSVWARPNAANQMKYAVEIADKAIKYLGELFHLSYYDQIRKMDLAAVPDFSAGAMENWGLLTFRETASLYDEEESSSVAQQRVASVIVHECTHMWFGNLVTPKWWSYLWLSEAFARYYQYMATDKIETNWEMDKQFVVEQHQSALGVDAVKDSVPMTRSAVTQSEIAKMGGTITYNKGASIVRMMELAFGTEEFNKGLRDYLKDRSYNAATPDNLWKALQKYVSQDVNVANIMKVWTEQPGFPVLSVNVTSGIFKLSQQRFLVRRENDIPTGPLWSIPITWTSSKNSIQSTKPVEWLSNIQKDISSDDANADWVIFNIKSAGFYRVNYDKNSWNKIIKLLTDGDFEKIDVLNRAAIVDDLLNLARADYVDYETALRGIQYLKRETNYLPFKSAFNALDYLIRKFSSLPDNDIFKEYIGSLTSNIYNKLTFYDNDKDSTLDILLRQELNIRACSFDHPTCVSESKKLFSKWRTNKDRIPRNQRAAAYCTALRYGTESDFEHLLNEYRSTNVAAEQTTILNALGCYKNYTTLGSELQNALEDPIKSYVRKQDISSFFSSVYSASKEGAEFIIEFVEENHDRIFKYHNNYDEIASIISGALQKYPTKETVSKVEELIKRKPKFIETISTSLQKSLDLAKYEVSWFETKSPSIIKWIKTANELQENTRAYRLPDNIIPSSYTILLSPYFEDKFTFDGKVTIAAKVKSATDKIVLHTDQLDIDQNDVKVSQVNMWGGMPNELNVVNVTRTEKYHFTNILLKDIITANSEITIRISYKGRLNTEMRGFYRSSYKVDGKPRWLAATHLEPVGARRVFPCFDEPALKASFDISVRVPDKYHAISNMKHKSNTSNLWVFETTPLMSTYLVAVVVSDFESRVNGKYSVWSNPLVAHQLDYSLSVMAPVIDFFEKKLGHKYTLPKMDMVALPDFSSGAMENWGLLTYRETNMLYDKKALSSLPAKQSIRNVIAHEITHQWFGDLVSPLWWDYLWLSEGFARYFQYHAYAKDEESWNLETQFVVDHLQTSMTTDASTGTHPITEEVYSPSEIRAIFDKISYAKAGSVIRMLEKLTGSKIFYAALKSYLEKAKYSTGTPEALFDAFQKEVDSDKSITLDVKEIMNSWTTQSGFPVLNVHFNGNKVNYTQERFYLRRSKNEEATWVIPLNWATKSSPNFTDTRKIQLLKAKSGEIIIENADKDWVIFNLQQTGYYRVNYDKVMWRRIIEVLNDSENYKLIDEINRASLIDDLLNLGRAGLVDYELVLDGLNYLRHETEYAPWKAALSNLAYLKKRFTGRPEIFDSYKDYLLKLLETNFQRLGFEDNENDRHTDILLRKLVLELMCTFEHEKCIKTATDLFQQERAAKKNVLPNQRPFVYCTAIKNGTNDDWEYLWKKFIISNYATERLTILTALACTKDKTKLEKLLTEAITPNSEIRLQDAKKVFTNVIDNGILGINVMLDYIEANYKKISEGLSDDSVIKSSLNTISKRLSTKELIKKYEKFIVSLSNNIPSMRKSLQLSLNRAKLEMTWYQNRASEIFIWLKRKNPKLTTNYRLPTSVKPTAYNIYLKPFFEENVKNKFTFEGKVIMNVFIEEETYEIVLHQFGLDIKTVQLNSEPIEYNKRDYNKTTQLLSIYSKSLLEANTTVQLQFDYSGQLRDDMRGFYRSYYVDTDNKIKWLASTQFEPSYARRAFPCFDEPSFKANFTIHIAKPPGYKTLSNMGSSPKESKEGDISWDNYEESIKMSPYVVAFVVSDFNEVKGDGVSVWSRVQLKDYMKHAALLGNRSLGFLEDFTKIKYPLKEMNLVAIPDFDMGAMENWGLVTFREYGLSYNTLETSATYKKYVVTTIAHELVHMWFGNLVTCEWWDYTWLNEGFAEYVSYLASDKIVPKWRLLEQFVVSELQTALAVDSLESSHPMNNKVITPDEAQDGFDKIAYQKSASVLRMLHNSVGDQVFKEALQQYLNTHQYSTARPEYLVKAFKDRLDREEQKLPGNLEVEIDTVMNSWTTQAGYPIVQATREGAVVTLSQERFLVSPTNSSLKKQRYWVPITYTTDGELDFDNKITRLWLYDKEKTINLDPKDKWFLLNIQEIGYYRVNYDKETWQQLINLLNSEEFSKIGDVNRAQLIDDLLNLARADYIDYDIALDATKYLVRETGYLPWKAYFTGTAYLSQMFDANSEIRELYANHTRTIIDEAYKKLGFFENMVKDYLGQLNREQILVWACKYGHEDCIKQAKEYFKKDSMTPNIATAVYCTAIEHGEPNDWNALWKKYENALLATDYITILKGLGCSKDVTILQQYLDRIIETNSKVRRQDVGTAFSSVYTSSQIGLKTAISYFRNNLDKLYNYYGNWHDVGSLFTSLASRITSEEEIENLEKLSSEAGAKEIQSSLKSAVKTAKKNLEWLKGNSEKIKAWLEKNYGISETTVTPETTKGTTATPTTTEQTDPETSNPPTTTPKVTEKPKSNTGSETTTLTMSFVMILITSLGLHLGFYY